MARLTPGTAVRHVNPELADWRGTVETNRRGHYYRSDSHDIWVNWHAGTTGWDDGQPPGPGWFGEDALIPEGDA